MVSTSIPLVLITTAHCPYFAGAPPPSTAWSYSSIFFTQSHSPFKFSFHKLTLLSPPLTASTLPLKLQLTRHSAASNSNVMLFHSFGCAWSEVQIRTVLSCDADAIYDLDRKVGAHATSRTQSVWPERVVVVVYVLSVGLLRAELA